MDEELIYPELPPRHIWGGRSGLVIFAQNTVWTRDKQDRREKIIEVEGDHRIAVWKLQEGNLDKYGWEWFGPYDSEKEAIDVAVAHAWMGTADFTFLPEE